ncbi:MAG: NAD-dependent epimerase/dehydratase family protein [Bacteroidia bacterium]|nr:NAD-dependent epimerase/dehydratase family protein [Bacteroidia bacterium]
MIVILGTGQVGRAVLDQLQGTNPGTEILLVSKSGKAPFDLPPGTRIVGADATRPDSLIALFESADRVFSCTDVPYTAWSTFYPALAVAMTEGLRHTKAKLVFADNLYSYGNLKGQPIHEGLSHSAHTRKGRIRAELLARFGQQGVDDRVAVVKSSDFIGPRIEKGLFGVDFLRALHRGQTVNLPGNLRLPHHFTFIEDFARAMVRVGLAEDAFQQTWHVPNAPAISPEAWVALFEQQTGRRIRYRAIPKLAVTAAGLFNAFVRELDELSYQFEYPYVVNSDKFIARFGDISTPHEKVVQETLRWFDAQRAVS